MMAAMVPLILLNLLGDIVAGVWLAALGEWWAIGYGIASMLFGTFLLGIAMMPGLAFGAPAVLLYEKGKTYLAFPLLVLSEFYTYALVSGWCLFVFFAFMSRANHHNAWPLLIWSYGAALGPWIYMAQQEQNDASSLTSFFGQVAYVVMALWLVIFGSTTLRGLALVFSAVMFTGMCIQIASALKEVAASPSVPRV